MNENKEFEKRYENANDRQKARFKKLLASISNHHDLTSKEKRYLLWLCDFDDETANTFINLFKKL